MGMKDVLKDTWNLLEDLYDNESWPTFKVTSGFKDLDFLTGGFHCGDLIMIVGGSGSGKNTLILNIASNVAENTKDPVGILSLKSLIRQGGLKFVSMKSGVRIDAVANGLIRHSDWHRFSNASSRLSDSLIYIHEHSAISIGDVARRIRYLKIQKPELKLIIIDSLQMIVNESASKISECLRKLKIVARECRLPVIITSLTNIKKGKQQNQGTKPTIADSKYRILEKYADVVIFLRRDDIDYLVSVHKL